MTPAVILSRHFLVLTPSSNLAAGMKCRVLKYTVVHIYNLFGSPWNPECSLMDHVDIILRPSRSLSSDRQPQYVESEGNVKEYSRSFCSCVCSILEPQHLSRAYLIVKHATEGNVHFLRLTHFPIFPQRYVRQQADLQIKSMFTFQWSITKPSTLNGEGNHEVNRCHSCLDGASFLITWIKDVV